MDLLTPHGMAVTWLPNDMEKLITRKPNPLVLIRVARVGGGSSNGRTDIVPMQVAVISKTRAQSWAVMEECRTTIRELCAKGPGVVTGEYCDEFGGVRVAETAEMVGPQQFPELSPDNRLVSMMFQFVTVRPR